MDNFEKTCKRCGITKPIQQFKSKGKQGGYKSYCIECGGRIKIFFRNSDDEWRHRYITKEEADLLVAEKKAKWKKDRLVTLR